MDYFLYLHLYNLGNLFFFFLSLASFLFMDDLDGFMPFEILLVRCFFPFRFRFRDERRVVLLYFYLFYQGSFFKLSPFSYTT